MGLFYNYQHHEVTKRGPATSGAVASCSNSILKHAQNDKGAVLVIALMLLAILTLLGVAALNTTTTEIHISGNDKVYKQAFYSAEAGIAYSVQSGVDIFPNAEGAGYIPNIPIPADLATASPGIALGYTDNGGPPRRVEVTSTGTVPGGGVSVIIAGLIGMVGGYQAGSGIKESEQYAH